MPINFKTLLKSPPCWMRPTGDDDDVILATVARMVRNLPGHPFPGWSTAEDRAAVANKLLPVLRSHPRFRYCHRAEMPELSFDDRCMLLERKQISPGMAARQDGCHLLITRDQEIYAMVNEEEHLCLHVSAPGFQVEEVLDTVADFSRHLEKKLHFARNAKDGYLTSMPQEAGDGLQLFAMLHLPALTLTGSMEKVSAALEKMHLSISPFTAENEDCGNLYILYTQSIPQNATAEAAEHFSHICETLCTKERRMEDTEFERPNGLNPLDLVYRAYGLLLYAHSLEYRELLHALSMIRMGLRIHLLYRKTADGVSYAVTEDILKLYGLSPAILRSTDKMVASARDARLARSQAVRTTMLEFKPLLFP